MIVLFQFEEKCVEIEMCFMYYLRLNGMQRSARTRCYAPRKLKGL